MKRSKSNSPPPAKKDEALQGCHDSIHMFKGISQTSYEEGSIALEDIDTALALTVENYKEKTP
jgi:hypothetical protein